MISSFTQLADSSSGIGALGIDGKAFVIQLVSFLLAFLVLQRYAFKPIVKIMNQRRMTIENGVKLGEKMKQEEADMEAKVDQTLRKARQQADQIISGAQDSGRQAVAEAEEKARQKADGIVAEAQSRIDQETARARKQLEQEVVSLISDATEAIIDEKVDAKKDAALIERVLKERQAA